MADDIGALVGSLMHFGICGKCGQALRKKWLIEAVAASEEADDLRASIVGCARRLEATLRIDAPPAGARPQLAELSALVAELETVELVVAHLAQRRASAVTAQQVRALRRRGQNTGA